MEEEHYEFIHHEFFNRNDFIPLKLYWLLLDRDHRKIVYDLTNFEKSYIWTRSFI